MKDLNRPVLGLSIGATTLAAVTLDRSMLRRPLVTLPSGATVTDFVDRVGDPVGIVALDGSVHAAETLLVDALRELALAVTDGHIPATTAIAYPTHWRRSAVDTFRRALRAWPADEPVLIPDTAGALAGLRSGPGLPDHGVIALLDLGGSGTTITLVDASYGDQPLGSTVRYDEFSGDLIDQALLAHVVAQMSTDMDLTGTSAIGSLTNLRAECRGAKERLSSGAATSLNGDFRMTRPELEEIMAAPLAGLVEAVDELLTRAGTPLAAVATVGGGASIPAITAALSERFRVPVVPAPRPMFTAAIGVALLSSRPAPLPAPAPVPEPPTTDSGPESMRMPALAWSTAPEVPVVAPPVRQKPAQARPPIAFSSEQPDLVEDDDQPLAWYRRPLPVVAAALIVIAMAGAGTVLALSSNTNTTVPVANVPVPSVTVTNGPEPAPVHAVQAPAAEAPALPAPQTYVQVPAPVTRTQVVQAPILQAQAPAPEAPAPPPPPPIPTVQIPAIPTIPAIPQIPQIPGLRFEIPIP